MIDREKIPALRDDLAVAEVLADALRDRLRRIGGRWLAIVGPEGPEWENVDSDRVRGIILRRLKRLNVDVQGLLEESYSDLSERQRERVFRVFDALERYRYLPRLNAVEKLLRVLLQPRAEGAISA